MHERRANTSPPMFRIETHDADYVHIMLWREIANLYSVSDRNAQCRLCPQSVVATGDRLAQLVCHNARLWPERNRGPICANTSRLHGQ